MDQYLIDEFVEYLRVYDVYSENGLINSKRIGRDFDGGYILPELALERSDALLGYGIRDDISFEEHYSQLYNKKSYGFDCSVTNIPVHNMLTSFIPECVGDVVSVENHGVHKDMLKATSFEQQLKNLNLEDKKLFIKMDIEGGEYKAMKDVLKHSINITGIAIEIHFDYGYQFKQALDLVKDLNKEFILTHIHGCNCHQITFISDKVIGEIPRIIEFSYINRLLVTSYKLSDNQYSPTTKDMSVCPHLREYSFRIL